MRSVRLADFKFQWVAPLVMGTRAHELARYVVYENPMPMLADDPAAYQGQIGLDFLRQVPTTWDETRVLAGRVGEYVVIARRHGDQWYLGAMNGSTPRTLTVPLWFLGARQFDADVYADDMRDGATASVAIRSTRAISERDSLSLEMSIAGGQAVRFTATAGSALPSAANSRK
jgi:alpha-glucosidase